MKESSGGLEWMWDILTDDMDIIWVIIRVVCCDSIWVDPVIVYDSMQWYKVGVRVDAN